MSSGLRRVVLEGTGVCWNMGIPESLVQIMKHGKRVSSSSSCGLSPAPSASVQELQMTSFGMKLSCNLNFFVYVFKPPFSSAVIDKTDYDFHWIFQFSLQQGLNKSLNGLRILGAEIISLPTSNCLGTRGSAKLS